jgi:phage portal protein BeeE
MVVSGRLSAALRPAGLTARRYLPTAAAVFAVCMLLAEAIAALPIAAVLEEPLWNPVQVGGCGGRWRS